jgi:predicted Zn-dependent peptidase
VGANEHFELVQRAGGTLNGSTWLDRTNYFETVPSNQLALALWLEADRMGRLLPAMTQQKLDTQRDVVKNERRWSVDNQPYGTWWERLPGARLPARAPVPPLAHRLDGGPRRRLARGRGRLLRHVLHARQRGAHRGRRLRPAEARGLVAEYFGPIPRGAGEPPLPDMALPLTFGPRAPREVVPDDVVLPRVMIASRIPPFGTPEHYAASVCGAVLGMRQGSRFHRELVRAQQVASDANAFTYDLAKGADLLVCDAVARPEVSAEALEAALHAQLDRVHADGVTDDEVARAVALIESAFVLGLQQAAERADQLSRFATYFGDPALANVQAQRYREVTAADVTAFARARLGRDNRAVLVYVPREPGEAHDANADAPVEDEAPVEVTA